MSETIQDILTNMLINFKQLKVNGTTTYNFEKIDDIINDLKDCLTVTEE